MGVFGKSHSRGMERLRATLSGPQNERGETRQSSVNILENLLCEGEERNGSSWRGKWGRSS